MCIVEAHQAGHGGSGRNVGLVNAGTWVPPDDVEKVLGKAAGDTLNRALGGAPALVFEHIDRYGIDCQDTRTGTLHMAHNAAGLADLRSRVEQWQRRGAKLELLTGRDCADACGTEQASGALLDYRAGTVNPMAYASGLAIAATQRGAQLYGDSPVTGLARTEDGWRVSTARGSVRAGKVIIASNAYTEGEWAEVGKHIFAGYYYQVASTPLSGSAADHKAQGRPGQLGHPHRAVEHPPRRRRPPGAGQPRQCRELPAVVHPPLGRPYRQPLFPTTGQARLAVPYGPAASASPPTTCCACSNRHRDWSPPPATTAAA